MNSLLLSPAMGLNRGSLQEFISVLHGEPQGCGCNVGLAALPLQWVYMGVSVGLYTRPLFLPSTLGSQALPLLHLEEFIDGEKIC